MNTLNKLISDSHYITAFTGAGISAESGIPTYRDKDGLWNKYDPSKYADIRYFKKDPSYYWKFFRDIRSASFENARPNQAHLALSVLEREKKLKSIITQNIDGLHQEAGSSQVLELHGSSRSFSCLSCDKMYDLNSALRLLKKTLPPECDECGGILRPDVILFGEALPQDVLYQATEATRHCDLFLVIGSSLLVQPAASLPVLAKENHAKLVIINMESTPLDSMADLVIHNKATKALKDYK